MCGVFKTPPAQERKTCGDVGTYEKTTVRVLGELDSEAPIRGVINDLRLASCNAHGIVEIVVTVAIFKPIDVAESSGVLSH